MTLRITMREAAQAAGVHRNTIRNWVKAGKLETAALEPDPDGRGETWFIDRDELETKGLVAGTAQHVPVGAATETETALPVVQEGYELVTSATLERLLEMIGDCTDASERVGRAEATAETLRERLNETRNELEAERRLREHAETELARLHGFVGRTAPAVGGGEPE